MQVDSVTEDVRQNGFSVVPDVFSPSECNKYKEKLEAVLERRLKSGRYAGSDSYQVLYHYFSDDFDLMNLVSHPDILAVMKRLIDQDFVLISPSARNPRLHDDMKQSAATSGLGWHIDARLAGDGVTAFKPSLNFYAVIMLNDFTPENGATYVLPGSHSRYLRPASRDGDDLISMGAMTEESIKLMTGKAGSVAFFDAAIWHAVGPFSTNSRWGVFNMYGPWFMKPYFDFPQMFDGEKVADMTPVQRQLLHLESQPPLNCDQGLATLKRVQRELDQKKNG